MSIERLKTMKEAFMCAVESQMHNLAEVDAEELGEVVDMVKDLSEAIYYCEVTKAMEDAEKYEKNSGGHQQEMMYYPPMYYGGNRRMEENSTDWRDERRYYNGSSGNSSSSSSGRSGGSNNSGGNSSSYYSEKEFPHAFEDPREGKSYRARRMYMESKESHQDKTTQMRELEKYAQELTQDIIEMVEDASPEEKQYMGKKITALANKITQLGSNG